MGNIWREVHWYKAENDIEGEEYINFDLGPSSTSIWDVTRWCSWRLRKGSINQRIGFRLGSGWIHHSSHLEVGLWTLGIGVSDTRVESVD